jgi:hypothetical protein
VTWDDNPERPVGSDEERIGHREDPDALPDKSFPGYVRVVAAALALALFVFFANLFFQLVL